jgi:hypothetical protein
LRPNKSGSGTHTIRLPGTRDPKSNSSATGLGNSAERATRRIAITEWQRFDTAAMLIVCGAWSNSFADGWLEIGVMFKTEQAWN